MRDVHFGNRMAQKEPTVKPMNQIVRLTALLAPFAVATLASAGTYQLTVTNEGPQPLSPIFYAASNSSFDIFQVGGHASTGIKNIAEMGNASALQSIAAAAGSNVGTYGLLGGSPLAPGLSYTTTFTTDAAHPYFQFAMMLGKTNDGFLGESYSSAGLNLNLGGTPSSFDLWETGLRAWDAGTEKNTQNAADLAFLGGTGNPAEDPGNDVVRVNAGVIPGVGDSWSQMPAWTTSTNMARIQVQAVPEPSSVLAIAVGLGGLFLRRRRS